jgi:hypothetical protein
MPLSISFDTPDTFLYMLAGYVVFIGLPVFYIASLLYRRRNLKRDEETIKSLLEDEAEKKSSRS